MLELLILNDIYAILCYAFDNMKKIKSVLLILRNFSILPLVV